MCTSKPKKITPAPLPPPTPPPEPLKPIRSPEENNKKKRVKGRSSLRIDQTGGSLNTAGSSALNI